jgi:predicted RNase H-like HicB family nuclease
MSIKATWDNDAKVWVVVNEELGIATEAETVEALLQKLEVMI